MMINVLQRKSLWLVLLLMGMAFYFFVIRNPLPSDEEMIAHFQKNRSDFDELINRYRNFDSSPSWDHTLWNKERGTSEMMASAGVSRVYKSAAVWLENPYSIETAKFIHQEVVSGKNRDFIHKHSTLTVKPYPRKYFRSFNIRYGYIWKDYSFFPEIPRIDNGELLYPVNAKGIHLGKYRALNSLNNFPGQWESYECVFRKVEGNWFLRMCNGH